MAKELLIRFGEKNLQRARDNLKAMQATARDLLKNLKIDPTIKRFLRKDLAEEQKKESIEFAKREEAERRRLRQLRQRGADLNVDQRDLFGEGAVKNLFNKGTSVANALEGLASGNFLGTAKGLLAAAGANPIVGLAASILVVLKAQVDKAREEERQNIETLIDARIERRAFETNFNARLRDPLFEQEQATEAFSRVLRVERTRPHKVWVRDELVGGE